MRACVCHFFCVILRPILFWRIVRIRVYRHIMTVLFLLCLTALRAEDSIPAPSAAPKPKKESELKAPVHYQAKDSMIMMKNGTAYLHGS